MKLKELYDGRIFHIETKYGVIAELWYNNDDTVTINVCPKHHGAKAKILTTTSNKYASVILVGSTQ